MPQKDRRIECIRQDRVSGAVTITRTAAAIIAELAEQPEALRDFCEALPAAQPMMAPLVRLVRAVRAAGPSPASVREACRYFVRAMEEGEQRLAHAALDRISPNAVVLTHSSSSAVRAALLAAHAAFPLREVICTESRPMREGVALAGSLVRQGIPTTLVTDAAMASALERSDLVLVGADAVTASSIINKTGTLILAHLCRAFGKPFYVLCGDEKFLPPDYPLPDEPERDPGEVAADAAPGVRVINRYFEQVPHYLVTGIVTGTGFRVPG